MSEIPEDLMKDAAHVAMNLGFELLSTAQVLTIAWAILAERRATAERCAKIAEDLDPLMRRVREAHGASILIAAAIRETVR